MIKKFLFCIVLIVCAALGLSYFWPINLKKAKSPLIKEIKQESAKKDIKTLFSDGFYLLRIRRDKDAEEIFAEILAEEPENLDALWAKAEISRRARRYSEAEEILNKVLKINPEHLSSLISLAYIRYKDDKLNEALNLIEKVLKAKNLDKENEALAYMMLGMINSRRSKKSWLFGKVKYGMQIKGYFLKAEEIMPDLPEVHLALGSFYLLAPVVIGGNLEKAIAELNIAYELAPGFATVNARLAQAYKRKGDEKRYRFHLKRAQELDPDNEVLKEILNEH